MSNLSSFIQYIIIGLTRLNQFEVTYNNIIHEKNLKKIYLGLTTMVGPSRHGDGHNSYRMCGRRLDLSKFSLINLDNLFSEKDGIMHELMGPPDIGITYCRNCSIYGEDLAFNAMLNNKLNDVRTLCYTKLAKINLTEQNMPVFQQESKLNYMDFYVGTSLSVKIFTLQNGAIPIDMASGFPLCLPLEEIKCRATAGFNDLVVYAKFEEKKKIVDEYKTLKGLMFVYKTMDRQSISLESRFMYSSTLFSGTEIRNNFNNYYEFSLISSYFIMMWGISIISLFSRSACMLDFIIHRELLLKGMEITINNISLCLVNSFVTNVLKYYGSDEINIDNIFYRYVKDITGISCVVHAKIKRVYETEGIDNYQALNNIDVLNTHTRIDKILCMRLYALLFLNTNCAKFFDMWGTLYNFVLTSAELHTDDIFLKQFNLPHKLMPNLDSFENSFESLFNENAYEIIKDEDGESISSNHLLDSLIVTDTSIIDVDPTKIDLHEIYLKIAYLILNTINIFFNNFKEHAYLTTDENHNAVFFSLTIMLLKFIKLYGVGISYKDSLTLIKHIIEFSTRTPLLTKLIMFINDDANNTYILRYMNDSLDDLSQKTIEGPIDEISNNAKRREIPVRKCRLIDVTICELMHPHILCMPHAEVEFGAGKKYKFSNEKSFLTTLSELRMILFNT